MAKRDIERKASIVIITVILAIVIVTAILLVRQKYFGPKFKYKDFEVTKFTPEGTTVQLYSLRVPVRIYASTDIYHIYLRNDPRTLSNISVENTTREVLLDPKPEHVYLTFDPEMEERGKIAVALSQVSRVLGSAGGGIFKFPVTGAVTKFTEGLNGTITCGNSNEENVVILFQYANETAIWVDETAWRCIIVQGRNADELIRAADRATLTLLGI